MHQRRHTSKLPRVLLGIGLCTLVASTLTGGQASGAADTPEAAQVLPLPAQILSANGTGLYEGTPPHLLRKDPRPYEPEPLDPLDEASALDDADEGSFTLDPLDPDPGLSPAHFHLSYVPAGEQDPYGQPCGAFPAAAKDVLYAAASIWSATLHSEVPISVRACWADLGEGDLLGYSGGETLRGRFPYSPELHLTTNSRPLWYFGLDANPPQGHLDLLSALVQQIGQGLSEGDTPSSTPRLAVGALAQDTGAFLALLQERGWQIATPQPDFRVLSISLTPSTPPLGGSFTATVKVKNQGTAAGDGKQLRVWSHRPTTPLCGAAGSQSKAVGILAAGGTRTLSFTNLPAGSAGGKTFRAFIDSQCQTPESNEANNQLTQRYSVPSTSGPDFVVISVSLTPSEPLAGGTFSASVTVKNQGTASGDGRRLDLWVNRAKAPLCGASGDQFQAVGSLAAGASKTLTFTNLPASSAGSKTLRVFVDSGCRTTESNEANNQHSHAYTVGSTGQPTYLQVSAGGEHTCALKSDDTLACWGLNDDGEATPPAGTFKLVNAGGDHFFGGHTCALRTDDTLVCWGSNDFGLATLPAGTFKQVSAGLWYNCALKTDDTLACWGLNNNGQATPPAGTFTQVSAGGRFFTNGRPPMAASEGHTCALNTDHTLACWGSNSSGQATPPAGTFKQVSSGGGHSCALRSDDTLACWGMNDHGQANPPAGTFTQVSAGFYHTCAIQSDDTLACWGLNDDSQATPPTGTFRQVSAGGGYTGSHACAIRSDDTLTCWGSNDYGQATPPGPKSSIR